MEICKKNEIFRRALQLKYRWTRKNFPRTIWGGSNIKKMDFIVQKHWRHTAHINIVSQGNLNPQYMISDSTRNGDPFTLLYNILLDVLRDPSDARDKERYCIASVSY